MSFYGARLLDHLPLLVHLHELLHRLQALPLHLQELRLHADPVLEQTDRDRKNPLPVLIAAITIYMRRTGTALTL